MDPRERLDKVLKAASLNFEKVNDLRQIFERRQFIARNYDERFQEEFDSLNALIKEHLAL